VAKFKGARWRQPRGAKSNNKAGSGALSRKDSLEVLAVIIALTLMAFGAHKLRAPDTLPITQVVFVNGPFNTEPLELKRAVAHSLEGNFFTVDLRATERALNKLGWVKSASVRRRWPDALAIHIREHKAIARWGNNALLSQSGRLFRPGDGRAPEDLPILHGPKGRERSLLARYREISATLKPANLSVRALVEDERRAWHLLLGNGIPVAIGRGDPEDRVTRFAHVYPQVLRGRARYIDRIDLRYTNGLAVAWKRSDGDGRALEDAIVN
jgi:cell division protein FtsQ